MAFSKNSEFKYSIRGIDRVVEERGNTFLRLAEIAWVGADEEVDPSKIHLDLRKYTTDAEGKEKMLKGVSFMTEQGPHELTHIMLEEGYGNTETVLNTIKMRSDFPDAVRACYGDKTAESDDGTFDLRNIL